MNKKQFKINKKKIKARRTWTRSPIEQVIPNKKKDDLLKGQKITEDDLYMFDEGEYDEFERGIK